MRTLAPAREILLALIVKAAVLAVIFVLFFSSSTQPDINSAAVSDHLLVLPAEMPQ